MNIGPMNRARLLVGTAFALALCAGVAVGLVSARIPEGHRKPKEPGSWLAEQLNLSSQQREQMKAIWQDFARRGGGPGGGGPGGPPGGGPPGGGPGGGGPGGGGPAAPSTGPGIGPGIGSGVGPGGPPGGREGSRDARGDERRRLERERNEAILAAVTDPEQRRRVELVMQEFERRQQEMIRERERLFDEAVEKTRAILDEAQRKKYDQIMQRRRSERESRGGEPATRAAASGAALHSSSNAVSNTLSNTSAKTDDRLTQER